MNLDAANVVGIKSFYDRCCISSTHFRLFDSFFQRQYADLVEIQKHSEFRILTHIKTMLADYQRQYESMNCFIYLVMDPMSQSLDHPNNNSTNLTKLKLQESGII